MNQMIASAARSVPPQSIALALPAQSVPQPHGDEVATVVSIAISPRPREYTVVIPVRDGVGSLRLCLLSLARQRDPPPFELVVVDDGSMPALLETFPPSQWPCPGRLVSQIGLGVAAARNRGIVEAAADVIVFIDADVVLEPSALAALHCAMRAYPGEPAFQIRLVSGQSRLVHRMEGLRLEAMQRLRVKDGRILYFNTSACAVRRQAAFGPEFFPVAAVRGEDTFVLARLIQAGVPPRFVPASVASHEPALTLPRYLWKHLSIGFHTKPARVALRAARGPMCTTAERARMFADCRRFARMDWRDHAALALIAVAFALELIGRFAATPLRRTRGRTPLFSFSVDAFAESQIVSAVVQAVRHGRSLTLTYLTAWSLVQANRDPGMVALLRSFDVCYADGMGVVVALYLLTARRLSKVTANNFFIPLCRELTLQGRTIALVGAAPGTVERVRAVLEGAVPGIRIVLTAHGYLDEARCAQLQRGLEAVRPDVVFVGMGQPTQEKWVERHRVVLPRGVFFCIGGLFDYLAGIKPTPPQVVRRTGFEWLYLLIARPQRYAYRYLIGLPLLAADILRFRLRTLVDRRPESGSRMNVPPSER